MTDSEKRKLFFKRWLQAFFSPFRRIKNWTRLENGVYDADNRQMRDVYFLLKMLNTAYLMLMCFFFGTTNNIQVVPSKIDNHALTYTTIFIPIYFILFWIKHTFFLAAFNIDENEETAKGEARDNIQIKEMLKYVFLGWAIIVGLRWFRVFVN